MSHGVVNPLMNSGASKAASNEDNTSEDPDIRGSKAEIPVV